MEIHKHRIGAKVWVVLPPWHSSSGIRGGTVRGRVLYDYSHTTTIYYHISGLVDLVPAEDIFATQEQAEAELERRRQK